NKQQPRIDQAEKAQRSAKSDHYEREKLQRRASRLSVALDSATDKTFANAHFILESETSFRAFLASTVAQKFCDSKFNLAVIDTLDALDRLVTWARFDGNALFPVDNIKVKQALLNLANLKINEDSYRVLQLARESFRKSRAAVEEDKAKIAKLKRYRYYWNAYARAPFPESGRGTSSASSAIPPVASGSTALSRKRTQSSASPSTFIAETPATKRTKVTESFSSSSTATSATQGSSALNSIQGGMTRRY
ncbi:hypothetical protein BGZ83_004835, partial [Gryganskiella cystojenkinii]